MAQRENHAATAESIHRSVSVGRSRNRICMLGNDRTLHREIQDMKNHCIDLIDKLTPISEEAAQAARRARSALFEAWTYLCNPSEIDDDH